MIKNYIVHQPTEALFLESTTDHKEIQKLLIAIPHDITHEGVVIHGPNGDDLIEFNKFFLLFDTGSNQLLSVEKDKFLSMAEEVKPENSKSDIDWGNVSGGDNVKH